MCRPIRLHRRPWFPETTRAGGGRAHWLAGAFQRTAQCSWRDERSTRCPRQHWWFPQRPGTRQTVQSQTVRPQYYRYGASQGRNDHVVQFNSVHLNICLICGWYVRLLSADAPKRVQKVEISGSFYKSFRSDAYCWMVHLHSYQDSVANLYWRLGYILLSDGPKRMFSNVCHNKNAGSRCV